MGFGGGGIFSSSVRCIEGIIQTGEACELMLILCILRVRCEFDLSLNTSERLWAMVCE